MRVQDGKDHDGRLFNREVDDVTGTAAAGPDGSPLAGHDT